MRHYSRKSRTIFAAFFGAYARGLSVIIFRQDALLLTSRRLRDRLLYTSLTILLTSTLPCTKRSYTSIRGLVWVVSTIIMGVAYLSHYPLISTTVVGCGRTIYILFVYRQYRGWIHTRRYRTPAGYTLGQVAIRSVGISLIMSISLISSISDHPLSCEQLENSLRRSRIAAHMQDTTLGTVLGLSSTDLEHIPIDYLTGSTQTEGALGRIRHNIIDLIIEQKDFLNHNVCTLVIHQITLIQKHEWWQAAGILLLFVLLRPLLSILLRLFVPFHILFWYLLLWTRIVKKRVVHIQTTTISTP